MRRKVHYNRLRVRVGEVQAHEDISLQVHGFDAVDAYSKEPKITKGPGKTSRPAAKFDEQRGATSAEVNATSATARAEDLV